MLRLLALTLSAGAALATGAPGSPPAPETQAVLSATVTEPPPRKRTPELENRHGYFPCMDCHGEQETDPRPRILTEEHNEPLEWEDDEGRTHRVEFGEYVAIRELLGKGLATGYRRRNLMRIGKSVGIAEYMEENGLTEMDSVWVLTHGGANLWCLDCHSADNRNMLHKLDGEKVSFDQSHLVCGQCHGPVFIDWEHGVHGRINGYWDRSRDTEHISRRLLCTECHVPHAPAFRSLFPEPPPVPRIDNISNPKIRHHHKEGGEYDDFGPHPWVKYERPPVLTEDTGGHYD